MTQEITETYDATKWTLREIMEEIFDQVEDQEIFRATYDPAWYARRSAWWAKLDEDDREEWKEAAKLLQEEERELMAADSDSVSEEERR